MKFFVKSMGMSSALTRGSAFWNTWNPQYFRSGEDVDANRDSARRRPQSGISLSEARAAQCEPQTVDDDPEKFWKRAFRGARALALVRARARQDLVQEGVPDEMDLRLP